ncbi:MAG: AMP-binding protein [Xanthomonadales bacterium]|nr:AMP-binding protein [Gammaproteobacteria bacterium]MBT8056965.1 AMP-binding protein [Gammaproteobacteria bacterium]NNJ79227.1 AMP-binding protein [Xanthomonadales bacterium]NNL03737.1 AMP-binding protein [Xanthomonadales bacterium]
METTWNTDEGPNVAGALSWQARRQPNATAIHYPSGGTFGKEKYLECSYQELDELSNTYARGLKAYGIGPGTRTALMLTPGLDFFAVFFALFKAGAVPVLIDPGIGMKPLKACLAEAAPKAFIGVTKAHFARKVLGWARESCELLVTAGPKFGLGGATLKNIREMGEQDNTEVLHQVDPNDMAAILFTSGSTGAPKGVVYRHRHFNAQVQMLKKSFDIQPGEVSLPTFPPFALFDPALGMTTVVPIMDPTRPADADPEKLIAAMDRFKVTNVFGSPALLDTLSRYCVDKRIRIESVTRVISAGAAVPIRTIRRMQQSLYQDAEIHTPYGATECLPVSSISASELNDKMVDRIESGDGVCVGRPIEPNDVKIIKISDMAFNHLSEATEMPFGMPGEIVVAGPSCTESYWQRENATDMAKMVDDLGNTWHRMGDVGVMDGQGRLWYCGRVSQRVDTGKDVLFPDQCEAIFNQHPDLVRSAVVGAGDRGRQTPVLCIEVKGKLSPVDTERVHFDLLQLAQAHSITREIRTVLFHPGFPVDIRHNSKIRREELAEWATKQMKA